MQCLSAVLWKASLLSLWSGLHAHDIIPLNTGSALNWPTTQTDCDFPPVHLARSTRPSSPTPASAVTWPTTHPDCAFIPSRLSPTQVYTPVIPNTGQRSDLANNTFAFWMITLSSVSIVYQGGTPPLLIGSNLTAIVDTGTSSIKGPAAPMVSIIQAYAVSAVGLDW